MAKKIKITTKLQNILIGVIVLSFCSVLAFKAINAISNNAKNITNEQLLFLEKNNNNVQEALNRHLTSYFESMSEIYYDDRIKKAVLTNRTRLSPIYKKEAHDALREFALFKDVKNILLFDGDYQNVAALNRTVVLTNDIMRDLSNRLENYKDRQIILQTYGEQNIAIFIYKIEYSELKSAYVVIIEDMSKFTSHLSNYETREIEFYLETRTLNYKNSIIKLVQDTTSEYFTLQEDTLMRYHVGFSRAFNANGEETISRVANLDGFQYSSVIGLLKPNYLAQKIAEKRREYINYYAFNAYWALFLLIVYIVLLLSKINLQLAFVQTKNKIIEKLSSLDDEIKPQELSKEAKKQAYSYIEDENALKNSVFKVYNSLRKMSPEDIRNLSIKNSLSKENIRLVYQPVVDSKTMQPQFCEVFLRLLNYYGEELMPSEFIPVLSHFNMLENLDEMMLEKVIRKIQNLQSTDQSTRISLNISSGAFNSEKFLKKLKSGLIKGNINTHNVMLEIPSLEIIENKNHSAFILDLAGYGVQFAVSVDVLDNETVKKVLDHKMRYVRIDMTNFSDVLESTEKQEILKQIMTNAKKYDLRIIAERIETEFMFKLAKSLDIHLLQGYHIGKPKKYYTHK